MLGRIRKIFSFRILQAEISRECNLNCKICMRKNLRSRSGFMSFNDFRKVLDSFNFREVALHGWGEPLLNPEIWRMIRYAKDKGIRTSLTTNGTLVGDNIDNILDSGLDIIAFGFYDMNILLKSIKNVEMLIKEKKKRNSGLKTFFDITIYKNNINEIPDVIKKANEISADAALLHRLFNLHEVNPAFKALSKEEEEKLFAKVKSLEKELNFKIYLPKKHTPPCILVKTTVFVTYDCKVTPCCFLPEFYIGDACKGVGESLDSGMYKNFISNMKYHEVCSRCIW